jgi:hypothetical protein
MLTLLLLIRATLVCYIKQRQLLQQTTNGNFSMDLDGRQATRFVPHVCNL